MNRLTVTVAALAAEGAGNLAIRLEPLPGQALPAFAAGAHIDVFLPGALTRQYSIASAPSRLDHYELCVKREPESRGGSRFIHQALAVGAQLHISSPRNLFALQPADHHVLVAAGIGITPLLSMASALKEQQQSFSLHYYTRTRTEAAYAERLETQFGAERVHLQHSDQGRSPRRHLPDDLLQPGPNAHLYLCGPEAFMRHMTERAQELGWPTTHIHQEAFAPMAAQTAVGDAFEVQVNSTGQVVQVPTELSIAQALMAAGVEVAVSCEQGFCGACLTRVVTGTPCHRDSVLSDGEKALNDQMALCCSRSRSGRLVLGI